MWQPFKATDKKKYLKIWDELGRFKTVKKDHEGKSCFDSLLDYSNDHSHSIDSLKQHKPGKPRDLFLQTYSYSLYLS